MPLKLVPYFLGAVMLALLGAGSARRMADPWHVVEAGSLVVTDARGAKLIFGTRTVRTGFVTTTEVQLPGGRWIDCRSECRDAVGEAAGR